MAKQHPIPTFSQVQLDYLNKLYPDRCPEPEDTDRMIWIKAGQRSVVRHVEHLVKQQIERSLTKLG